MMEISDQGDNFRTRGPWRILTGTTWFRWQCAAVEAERRAAAAVGDEVAMRRSELRLVALRRSGALLPAPETPPGSKRDGP